MKSKNVRTSKLFHIKYNIGNVLEFVILFHIAFIVFIFMQKNPGKTNTKMSASTDDTQNNPQSPTEEEVKKVMENNAGDANLPSDFSLDTLRTSFEGCITEDGKILLKNYITGFEELYKFLNLLGTVFGWVSTDVDNKIGKNSCRNLDFMIYCCKKIIYLIIKLLIMHFHSF